MALMESDSMADDWFVGSHSFLRPSGEAESDVPTESTGSRGPKGEDILSKVTQLMIRRRDIPTLTPCGPHQLGPKCVEFSASDWATNPTSGILIPVKATAHVTVPIRLTWGSLGVCWLMSNHRLSGGTE